MTYLGSKVKYSKYITPILQSTIDKTGTSHFYDICCGGCNIIKNIKCKNRIAVDNDKFLIALWKELQKPDFQFPSFPTREDWDRCKNGEEERDWYVGLTAIFTSYLCRGFPGGYNKQERQYIGRVNTVKKDLPLIQDIEFISADYDKILLSAKNSVIYIDPPYAGTKEYNSAKHFDYERFWNSVRTASLDNYVYISEQQAPADFVSVWSLDTNRLLQGNNTKCTENLFVYKNGLTSN